MTTIMTTIMITTITTAPSMVTQTTIAMTTATRTRTTIAMTTAITITITITVMSLRAGPLAWIHNRSSNCLSAAMVITWLGHHMAKTFSQTDILLVLDRLRTRFPCPSSGAPAVMKKAFLHNTHHPPPFYCTTIPTPPPPSSLCVRADHHLDHKHDDRVTSVGIQMDGSCDMAKLNTWLSKLLQVRECAFRGAHLGTAPHGGGVDNSIHNAIDATLKTRFLGASYF